MQGVYSPVSTLYQDTLNFQPSGTQVGSHFHFDHGVGIERNRDAQVLWIME